VSATLAAPPSILATPPEEHVERCPICGGGRALVVARRGVLYNRYEELTPLVSHLCLGCGVIYTSPRLSRATLDRFYQVEQARRRRQPPLAEVLAQPESPKAAGRVAFVLPHLPPAARVLEIGAGDGRVVAALARRLPGGVVTGLDAAYEGDARPAPGVRLLAGRVDERTSAAGLQPPYDCVAAFHVLEHQHDPVAFLRALTALLAPGGVLYLEVPNTYRHWWLGKDVEVFFNTVHLFNYGRRSLAALLGAAGLEPAAWQAPAKALRVIARAGGPPGPPPAPPGAGEIAAISRYFLGWALYSRWRRLPLAGALAPLGGRLLWRLLALRRVVEA
jgi:2-polyprenyl-3-methyl-5-hydroxy-6-metoxy-1,4-benzoquinol methylase